ncbi:hypothetical protein [uncultured Methanolobus sp.]|uniref:hypothetical protein n=1 Tax=uncultured Methanolobus sp. TaxID=218300 RepID=UPI002AAAE2F9|nr:hypothetical protein [uncultured Methanolobus sp.]
MPLCKPILFFLTLLFLITPVSADELVTNGGFESSLSGWNLESSYHLSLTSGKAHTGIYSLAIGSPNTGYAGIYQTVDFTNVDNLTFYALNFQILYSDSIRVFIDGAEIGNTGYIPKDDQWHYYEFDVSAYEGNHVLYIRRQAPGGSYGFYIDDVSAISVEPVSNDYVDFVLDESLPDKWVDIDYSIDNMQDSYTEYDVGYTIEHEYKYFLRFDHEGRPTSLPITLGESSGTKQYKVPHFDSYPDVVEVQLIEDYGEYQVFSGLLTVVGGYSTYLATDTIAVTTGANNTGELPLPVVPEEPDNPILDPIELPIIPDLGGDETNFSYNSTYLPGYFAYVDSLGNYLFEPVENGFEYLMYPVTTVNSSVSNATGYFMESSAELENYNSIITVIFAPIINSMPPKVQAVVTYDLTWLLIIMIFKRK